MSFKPSFTFICLFLTQVSAWAGTTYAVVVGISDYKILNYKNGDLRYADDDAKRIVNFLSSKTGGEVPTENIVFLTNSNATKASILTAMRIFAKATANDRVIFYFSGHGLVGAFVPYDIAPNNPASALSHAEVKAAFRASSAGVKLCIADACMSGSMKLKESWGIADSQPKSTPSQIALILSSRLAQLSVENRKIQGGVFTYFMLTGLIGLADKNNDKLVTIRELYKYMSPKVKKVTPNHQEPLFYGKFSDDLVLSYL